MWARGLGCDVWERPAAPAVKRAGFPRFYFLGNLEMVEMMVG